MSKRSEQVERADPWQQTCRRIGAVWLKKYEHVAPKDDHETHVRLANELLDQWMQTWSEFNQVPLAAVAQPHAPNQAVQPNGPTLPAWWIKQQRARDLWIKQQREQGTDLHGPGDGVTTCSDCGYKLTELFLSKACDRCDGLLQASAPPAAANAVRYALCFMDDYEIQNRLPTTANLTVPTRDEALSWIPKLKIMYAGKTFGLLAVKPGNDGVIYRCIWSEDQRVSQNDSLIVLFEANI